ncbi:sensor histidine kinase [Flindersiella endophytica]
MVSGRRLLAVWRSSGYLLGSLLSALATLIALPVLWHPGPARWWADWHSRRAGRLLAEPVTGRPLPSGRPFYRAFADPATRRDLAWLPVGLVIGGVLGLATLLCLGNILVAVSALAWWAFPVDDPVRMFVEVPVTGWATALGLGAFQFILLSTLAYAGLPPLARLHARACLALLAPSAVERLASQVDTLTRTRADVLDAHAAELRRIERDLHDGAQARLVGIAMRLAVAREALPDDENGTVSRLLREAHEATEDTMTDLRSVLRTIYPPILADRGLAGALRTVVAGCGVPATLTIDDLPRVPAAVEAVAYFVVTEALTNVVKHSRASQAGVTVTRGPDRLCLEVTDDGAGGADETLGTGLTGIRHRVLALDGVAEVSSPAGGPTTIRVELPCEW